MYKKKIRVLILLASLFPSYESLVTTLLMAKSTIKMDEITIMILQNEILRRKNPFSSSVGGSSALVVSRGAGGSRWSNRGSQGG